MRIDFSVGEEVEGISVLGLDKPEIRKLFRFLEQHLKKEKKWTAALEILKVSTVGSLEIHCCDDVEMRALQNQYRNLDRTTDVLSFPSIDIPEVGTQFSILPSSERSWGTLVLSHEAVARGAERGRRSLEKESLEVLIHGFLHLLGYDHVVGTGVTRKDAKIMKDLQERLFQDYLALAC